MSAEVKMLVTAEVEMLAGLIRYPERLPEVMALVEPNDMAAPETRQIFEQMSSLIEDGVKVTEVTLIDREPDQASTRYLPTVADICMGAYADPLTYAKILNREKRKAEIRRLAIELEEITDSQNFDTQLNSILADVSRNVMPTGQTVPVSEAKADWFKRMQEPRNGCKTGFDHLDRRLQVLGEGELSIVAGRPGMGKSSFAMDVALRNKTLFVSLEMDADSLIGRAVSSIGKIDSRVIRSRKFSPYHLEAIESVQLPEGLTVVDNPFTSITEIEALCARLKPELVIVDYLQLMEGKGDNRTQQIGSLSRGLKRIAKQHRCHVMALSQLNRGLEQRINKRPLMSDLRESGEIEQDADMILLLYRHGVYSEHFEFPMVTEVEVAKFRGGEPGRAYLDFVGEFTTFNDLDDQGKAAYIGAMNAQATKRSSRVPEGLT